MNRLGMTYKGYTGVLTDFEPETGTIYGHVVGLQGGITFQSESGEGLVLEFHESVDVYLEWCEERGVTPEKPYSGKFLARMSRSLHKSAALKAAESGVSLNELVRDAVRAVVTPRVKTPKKSPKVGDETAPNPRRKVTAKSSKPSA